MLVTTPMTETLTVVSVGDGSTLDCDGLRSSSTVDTRAIVLETVDLEHLTLLLRMPGLPDDALLVNDVVGMDLRASPGGPLFFPPTQTVVLTRNDELLLFVATDGFTATLAPHDIAMSDGGKMCGILGLPLACGFVDHRLRVRSGTSESTFEPGQTKQVGTLSVTLDQYNSREGGGGCDAAGSFRVGAFVP
jgi:hypothetical protein